MSQTLQQSLLLAKSMNSIISFDDGAGTTISNGQVITNGVNTDTLTTNTLSVPSLTITDLTVTGDANVPTVATSDNSINAASTAFVKNQGYAPLAANNTFSGNNTFNGATTLSGATTAPTMPVVNNSTRVATTAFVKNQNYTTLAGIQSNNNVFTGTNQFSNITYSNVSSAFTLTNPDFTSPSYSGTTALIYTGTTSSSTYSISGWDYSQDAGTLNLYINNNSNTPFYLVNYPTASNNASVMQYNPSTFGNRAYCRSILYSLIAGEYELIFYLQTNFNQSPPLSVDVSVESFGVTQGAIKNITPAQSYPEWVQYKIGFNLSATTNCQIQISQAEGYCMYTGFSLTLTNAINVTDGTTLSSIGAKQSLLNDLYVNNSLTVASGGIVAVGGLSSGSTFGTSNTILNSRMGATSSLVNNSCISIGLGAANSLNGGIRNILMGDYTGLSASLTESILIGFFQGGMGSSSTSNVAIGNGITTNSGPYGENSLVGYGIGSIFQGGGVGYRNSVIGANCFNKYAGFGGVTPSYCAVVGWNSNYQNGSSFNSALGSETLYNITGLDTGTLTQYNTACGYRSGYAFDGLNNCSFLGALADVTVANLTNATAIGYNCKVAASNTIQLGSNGEIVSLTGQLNIKQDANQRILIYDTVTAKNVIRFNNANQSIGIGADALLNEDNSGVRNNTAFGANALKALTIGRYNTALGESALQSLTGTSFSQNVAIGYRSLVAGTTCVDNVAVGVSTGGQVLTGSRNTFLGTGTDFSSATQYSDSTALGYGALITASNQIVLGRSTETVNVQGLLQVDNNYVAGASPTLITTTITLSGVLFQYYSVTSAAAYSITLPAPVVAYLGCSVTFRRVGVTITNAVTSASANIFQINSVGAATNVLLAASTCQTTIVCLLINATPTYGWFKVS